MIALNESRWAVALIFVSTGIETQTCVLIFSHTQRSASEDRGQCPLQSEYAAVMYIPAAMEMDHQVFLCVPNIRWRSSIPLIPGIGST